MFSTAFFFPQIFLICWWWSPVCLTHSCEGLTVFELGSLRGHLKLNDVLKGGVHVLIRGTDIRNVSLTEGTQKKGQ